MLPELQPVTLLESRPFRPVEKFDVRSQRQLAGAARQIVDTAYAQFAGALLAHRQHIGIFEAEPAKKRDAIFGFRPARQLAEHLVAWRHVAAAHRIGPQRSRIIDIGIEFAVGERPKGDGRTQAFLDRYGGAGLTQAGGDQFGENELLAKILGADHISAGLAAGQRNERDTDQRYQPRDTREQAALVAQRGRFLHQSQQQIDQNGEDRGGRAAKQNEHPVLGLQAGEDIIAEARLADRRRQCRSADRPHGSHAYASHDHGGCERQIDLQQLLAPRHADALRGFRNRRIDAGEAGHGIPQDRQNGIKRQRGDRRQEAEGRNGEAETILRQLRNGEQHRIEQGQHGKARNGLDHAGDGQKPAAQTRKAQSGGRKRNADQPAQHQRGEGQ